ncbi:hypothetical protein E2C01_011156 [Portunus trituberculatus]|uniref:Uncharacterized protein n=1 Tax=Portunus trituberculatus TaxID=210409 RepID=A0A5B7DAK6_PORTR|nr:hypothetical protein [Portunus trituberculatus]
MQLNATQRKPRTGRGQPTDGQPNIALTRGSNTAQLTKTQCHHVSDAWQDEDVRQPCYGTDPPDDEANTGEENGYQHRHGDQHNIEEHHTPQPELVPCPQEVGEELVADEEGKKRVHCQDLEEEEATNHRQHDIMWWEVVQEILTEENRK